MIFQKLELLKPDIPKELHELVDCILDHVENWEFYSYDLEMAYKLVEDWR